MAEKVKGKTKKQKNAKGESQRKVDYSFDPSFKLREPKVKKTENPTDFHPVYFLRTHSKNNDPADVQTQIWQCSFEPDPRRLGCNTKVVATCGGSSVCFVNMADGEVLLKYNRSNKVANATQNLYAQAWTTMPLEPLGLKTINVLAAGGARSTVLLIHPDAGVCYQMFRTVPNKPGAVVCALLFHPKKATWLFCGHEDGQIQLWDVDTPNPPSYEVTQVHLLTIPNIARDVYNLTFSCAHDLLISGCDGGLYAWKVDAAKIERNERLDRIEFVLPEVDGNGSVVDSIEMVRDDILATKCALHGQIYVFSISLVLKSAKYNKNKSHLQAEVKANMMVTLRWSDTDNYYMNMGVDKRSCILVCGDDKGALWVYDLCDLVTGKVKSPLTGTTTTAISKQEPVKILEWPELEDAEVEKARKLRLDTYDIVVDKCAVSDGSQYIVAVTSNNMVCVWKHGSSEDQQQEEEQQEEEEESERKKKKVK